MQINTLRLQNLGDRRTLDFLFYYYYYFTSLYFIFLWQENLEKHALFQLPVGEYVLVWDGIMALGLRTKSGMGIQTAHVLVSYSALGLSVAGNEQLWDRHKGWAQPFNVAAEQAAKSRCVKLKLELFPQKPEQSPFLIPKKTGSPAQIMSRETLLQQNVWGQILWVLTHVSTFYSQKQPQWLSKELV